jgi:hypothetical protein
MNKWPAVERKNLVKDLIDHFWFEKKKQRTSMFANLDEFLPLLLRN